MSVAFHEGAIWLDADCPVEEAETLAGLLAEHRTAPVDISGCGAVHGAVAQALISFAPQVRGTFTDQFLNLWVLPALDDQSGGVEQGLFRGSRIKRD